MEQRQNQRVSEFSEWLKRTLREQKMCNFDEVADKVSGLTFHASNMLIQILELLGTYTTAAQLLQSRDELATLLCDDELILAPIEDHCALVDEILSRYYLTEANSTRGEVAAALKSVRLDASVDSGVCPSPDSVEYDAAFPPLDVPSKKDSDEEGKMKLSLFSYANILSAAPVCGSVDSMQESPLDTSSTQRSDSGEKECERIL